MAKYPNREALRKAHDIYRDAMREFIIRCLKRIQGATVEKLVRDSLGDHGIEQFKQDLQRSTGNIEGAIDISHFPYIIKKYWKGPRGFSQKFGLNSKVRDKTGFIVEGRNFWAHPGAEDLTPESTQTHLFVVAEVLGEINKPGAKREVEEIRDRLFSDEVEVHRAEAENADLKERLSNKDDELKAEKEQHQDTQNKLAEMEGMEAAWLEMDEDRKAASKKLTDARAENVELNERLSETENRRKTIELESNQLIKTLRDQLRTVVAEKTELEERLNNSPKQPETLKAEYEEHLQTTLKQLKIANAVKTELEERLEVASTRLEDVEAELITFKEQLPRTLRPSDSVKPEQVSPAAPDLVTFYGTAFTKHLNTYYVEEDDITQTFWHYWHAQGSEGKEEMRDAGWNVEKVNDDWEITISTEDFQAWIESEVIELRNLFNASGNEELPPQPVQPVYKRTTLPTGKEMEKPALELLEDRREHRRVEIINCLTEYFSLTDDARRYLSKTGQAEKHLVKKRLITRTRTGYYRITTRGLQVLR